MNDAAHFIFLIGLLLTVVFVVRAIEAYAPKFLGWFRQTAHPFAKTVAGFIGVVFLAIFVTSKDFSSNSIYNFSGTINESPYISLYSPAAAALLATFLTNSLTPAQVRAGFALTAVTNVVWDFSAPTNAFFCDLGHGVHDEAYWIPLTFSLEGTATNSRWGRAVCATPSGMVLLDDLPDRLAPSFPDLSGAVTNRVLSILQTPSGLLPPAGKLWDAATTNNSHLITWEHLFLGRDTNAIANLQLELFQNGDFIYRIQLDEDGDYSSVTNWLIAAQSGSAASGEGGEVFAFSEDAPVTQLETDPLLLLADTITANPVFAHLTNGVSLHSQALELRWTAFGDLDPDDESGTPADTDHDGLSDWDELFVYHTDPTNPDTDADGLWDGEEINQYDTSPVNSDSNNDGELDFWQVFSPSSFTNAPWAEESEDSALLYFTTHLENTTNSQDLAVLRIGNSLIPVLPNETLSARVAIPKGGEAAFILLPGPGLSESATAMLWVTASTGLVVFDDPFDAFTVFGYDSGAYSAPSPMRTSMAVTSSSATTPCLRPTGKIYGIDYDITPQTLCPHTGRGVLRFINTVNPGKIPFGFLINQENNLISDTYTVTDDMIGKTSEDTPGYHGSIFNFYVRADPVFKQAPRADTHSRPAHYCVPIPSNYEFPGCDPEDPSFDPYAIPAILDPEGHYYGTDSRAHVQLIIEGGDDHVCVDFGGDTSYANCCPICGCAYGPDSNHTPGTTASVYRQTLGLEVSPQTLTTNGCFTVSGIKPSSDYGADVFTYQIGSWYNRGRYTVLGLKNHLAYSGESVDMAHVAVGVTNALVFWTGVKLPTGDLNLSLVGDGQAEFIVSNRVAHTWDKLLSPTITNYTANIVNWRNTYCDPDTLRVQAYLAAKENGLCTLTQSFTGSGNDISISHSVSQLICIHTFIAEPITSETYTGGYVYNPSGIPVGETAKFKVSLDPMTGFTENDIVWDASGVTFVNGDNTGPEVTVQGGSSGSYMLTLEVNGLSLIPNPFFFGKVMTPTTAPVTVWIVRNNAGTNAPIAQSEIQPIIDDANKILRQKALTLSWSGTANYTNRTEWQDITDAMNPTNSVLNALLDCSTNTGGMEIYFINTLTQPTLGGLNGNNGLILAKGTGPTDAYAGFVLAHEVGHQCGLKDIYVNDPRSGTSLVVSGFATKSRLLQDWGGGYYPKELTQAELIQRIIMCGVGSTFDPEPAIDLPSGPVYGLCYTNAPVTNAEIWYLGTSEVGQSDILYQTPEHN